MANRLYVANLPDDPNEGALRAHFARCGEVTDVEIVADRDTGRQRASAFVKMSRDRDARQALSELDGEWFEGQVLRIVSAPERQPRDGEESSARDRRARITQQFRELNNMTYELDCAGTALTVRVFFATGEGAERRWQVVVHASHANASPGLSATGPSRSLALREVAASSRAAGASALAGIDWEAVEQALSTVRAV